MLYVKNISIKLEKKENVMVHMKHLANGTQKKKKDGFSASCKLCVLLDIYSYYITY